MTKDDATWLKICYVALAALFSYIAFQSVYTVGLQNGWIERYDEWFPLVNNISAIFLGASAAFWVGSNRVRREYHESAIGEIRKVKWPSIPDTKKMTVIVVIVVAIFAVILAVFDMFWTKALQSILP